MQAPWKGLNSGTPAAPETFWGKVRLSWILIRVCVSVESLILKVTTIPASESSPVQWSFLNKRWMEHFVAIRLYLSNFFQIVRSSRRTSRNVKMVDYPMNSELFIASLAWRSSEPYSPAGRWSQVNSWSESFNTQQQTKREHKKEEHSQSAKNKAENELQ